MPANSTSQKRAWVITGPASGISYRTARELLAALAVGERR